MGETPDDVKREVEQARAKLGQDLNELEYSVRTELDWRVQFARRPWVFLGAAFGAAAAIGMLVSGGPRSPAPARR